MRKFLVIATLFILLSNQSVAKDFFLVCEGKMQSTSAMHKSTDNLFEEWKITTVDKKIFIVELINTGAWNYRSGYLGGDLSFTNNVINIDVYNEKAGRGYTIKKYTHSISLNSGRFSWSQFLESSSVSWVFQAQGKCDGYKEILRYLN